MAKVVKNKFIKEITASSADIKGRRASILAGQVTAAQQLLVNSLTQKCDALELKLDELMDLSPKSTTSLRVGSKDFNAQEWVREVQANKVSLAEAKVELEIAEETFDEWFADLAEEVVETTPGSSSTEA